MHDMFGQVIVPAPPFKVGRVWRSRGFGKSGFFFVPLLSGLCISTLKGGGNHLRISLYAEMSDTKGSQDHRIVNSGNL